MAKATKQTPMIFWNAALENLLLSAIRGINGARAPKKRATATKRAAVAHTIFFVLAVKASSGPLEHNPSLPSESEDDQDYAYKAKE
ncbi:MAG: hypothetical protein V6Z86_08700 [Hyphomicrobiales bacterium]